MSQREYSNKSIPFSLRNESFGGIAAFENPPKLVFCDHQLMKSFSNDEKEQTEDSSVYSTLANGRKPLSAPTEVHFSITSKCSNGCAHCYQNSDLHGGDDLPLEKVKQIVDRLAQLKVFHIALGGGESLEREDLFEIAAYIREKGMIPNLTLSGTGLTPKMVERLSLFGQINVSLDSPFLPQPFRSDSSLLTAKEALRALLDAGYKPGINAVLGKENFDHIPQLFKTAAEFGLSEIEFLRLKPVGRAVTHFDEMKMSAHQNKKLLPFLMKWSRKTGVKAKIDCSFVPMLCYHRPSVKMLEKNAVFGCEAGNVLLGISSRGGVSGCSFLPDLMESDAFFAQWPKQRDDYLSNLVVDSTQLSKPCRNCRYFSICRGGCQAVVNYYSPNGREPDPDCPIVSRYRKRKRRSFLTRKKDKTICVK